MTPRPVPSRPGWLRLGVLVGAAALSGCLPSSQRERDRSVSAAVSASAALAEAVPVDTLAVVWTARAAADDPMPMPSSLAWLGDTLAVVETQTGSVRWFRGRAPVGRTDLPDGSYPYVAGARGDTLMVLARGTGELLWVTAGGVARRLAVPGATAALATADLLAVRLGGGPDTTGAALARLSASGAVLDATPMPGPAWRSVGFLRALGDTVVALSGYRPVVDVFAPGAPADTLALVGFASPQAARSAQFMRGEAEEPPLLTSSAAFVGGRLFVLNLRADHVRVDVYDRGGRLQRVLVSPRPWAPDGPVALDLAARRRGGAVELAVLRALPPGLLRSPDAEVTVYRWGG